MAATQAAIHWAHRYDGYSRLASSPEGLLRLIEPVQREWFSTGRVPEWCGVDLLRGWAFYLVRADRHAGGGTLDAEWEAVLEAVRQHPHSTGLDRPPVRPDDRVALPTRFSTKPKAHKDGAFLAAKQARWWEPHVAPVNQFVDRIRDEIAEEWADDHDEPPPVFVPYIDPDCGGVRAKVLFLLESPAGPAALGSRMLSADNDDGTAKNMWLAYEASSMPRTVGLHWNAVPWYVGDGRRNKNVMPLEVERGRGYLEELLDLAPEVSVVLALGKPAQVSASGARALLEARGIQVVNAPHPSPRLAATTKGDSLMRFNAAVQRAFEITKEGGPS